MDLVEQAVVEMEQVEVTLVQFQQKLVQGLSILVEEEVVDHTLVNQLLILVKLVVAEL